MATTDDPSGFSDSDWQWFARLGGKPVEVKSERALREADLLRAALEAEAGEEREQIAAEADEQALDLQWQRLRFRARREGAWNREAPAWRGRWPTLGALAAALVLGVALVPVWQSGWWPGYDAPPVLRGEFARHTVRVDAPRRRAETFAAALRQAGIKAAVYRQAPGYVVDVTLDAAEVDLARPAFAAQGLVPAAGTARIGFLPE